MANYYLNYQLQVSSFYLYATTWVYFLNVEDVRMSDFLDLLSKSLEEVSIESGIHFSSFVPVFEGTLNGQPELVVDLRALHTFLGSRDKFTDWVKHRIIKYGFEEGVDFTVQVSSLPQGGGVKKNYHFLLDCAKEIAMVENNNVGREVRRYFIAVEKKFREFVSAEFSRIRSLESDLCEANTALIKAIPKSDLESSIFKAVDDGYHKGKWLTAYRHGKQCGLLYPRLTNKIYAELGYLVRTPLGWSPTPLAKGLIDNPIIHYTEGRINTRQVIYSPDSAVFLEGNAYYYGRQFSISVSRDIILPEGIKFMQEVIKSNTAKITALSVLSKAVDILGKSQETAKINGETAKINGETAKINGENISSLLDLLKRLTPESASKEGLLPIEDANSCIPNHSNVVAFNKVA